jgi:hypothetical protein
LLSEGFLNLAQWDISQGQRNELVASLGDKKQLHALLEQTTQELNTLQEDITQLDQLIHRLATLRQRFQTLQGLKHSVETLLKAQERGLFDEPLPMGSHNIAAIVQLLEGRGGAFNKPTGMFYPEKAFEQADLVLKRRQSINYEMFRAIAFNGGVASSAQIRQFLIDQLVLAPRTKQPFDERVPLSEITARLDYLIKKGLVRPEGNGRFWSAVGWESL